MRREKAIRAHLDNLKAIRDSKCRCPGCTFSRLAIAPEITLLEWVLGDNDDLGDVVEDTAALVAEARRRGVCR